MYDYGWRQYMPDVGRWMQLDPLVEDTQDPYAYVYNNPISLTDPDGREPDDVCCQNLKGFTLGVIDDLVGTNLRNSYGSDSPSYRNGVRAAHVATFVGGSLLATDGLINTTVGTGGLATSAVIAGTGVGAPVGGLTATASGIILVKGVAETVVGGTIASRAVKNMQSDNNSQSSSKKSNPKKEAREAGKAKRENQPGSEKRAKDYGKQLEKEQGKDARREAHDAKDQIGKDRTVKELKEDYKRK